MARVNCKCLTGVISEKTFHLFLIKNNLSFDDNIIILHTTIKHTHSTRKNIKTTILKDMNV